MKTIPLTRGYVALVDDADWEELSKYKWQATTVSPGHMYAMGRHKDEHGIRHTRYMHRIILNAQKGETVDHIDGNRLNNQRSNIRICTTAQNVSHRKGPPRTNTSGYIGVSWRGNRNKWEASVMCKRVHYFLGLFDCPIEAARVRDQKARELHGEYAYLNFAERETRGV